MASDSAVFEGGCTCRAVRYRMTSKPMFVHCCHCRWCQRETGASFALNALIEATRVELLQGQPEVINTPSNSGKGQRIARCLDEPDRCPPDIHIFTSSKQPWVVLPPGARAVPEYYSSKTEWPAESLARRAAVLSG